MRPAPVPASSNSTRKAISKEQIAADSLHSAAEAILLDALLCGWEQHSNDGVCHRLMPIDQHTAQCLSVARLTIPT